MRNLGLAALVVSGIGCNSILGIGDHELAGNTGGSAGSGAQSVGGSTSSGRTSANAGGSSSVGGTNAKSGSSSMSGGTLSVGGTQAIGGNSHNGGSSTSGGMVALGGATGTTGGASPVGGTSSAVGGAGGASFTGGTKNGGGSPATGGTPSTGGATTVSTGGTNTMLTGGSAPVATGGTRANGGTTSAIATGGAVSTGGAATGGAATGGSVATGGAAGSGCTGSFETIQSGSAGLCVAKMVPINAPSASNNYSIDATEVTKGQYDMWLATIPALPASTDANCSYVTSYAEQGTGYTGTDADHHPVVYVDWCNAYAYCKGVGKRLCGAIGGGTNPTGSEADASASQWYRACSSGGAYAFPYGTAYQASTCDGYDYWNDNISAAQTVVVGSFANCVTSATGYAGVYDLSGNVYEWEDSCSGTGESADCTQRSGAFYYSQSSTLNCANADIGPRNTVSLAIGFRCCAP